MRKILITIIILIISSACASRVAPMPHFDTPLTLPSPMPSPPPEVYMQNELEAAQIEQPTRGGFLRLSMRAPQTLNPLLNEDTTVARVLQLMFEPLLIIDEYLQVVPHLASLEFSVTSDSAVISLRENARWSDGEPITADDIIFSINTLRNAPEGAIYRNKVENFAQLDIINERSVRITFYNISGGSAYLFNFPIIPRHYFQNNINSMRPVSSGPFRFVAYTNMESMSLERNPYSFRPQALLEGVNVIITVDAETDRNAFDRSLTDIYLATVPEWTRHHNIKPVLFAEHLAMQYEFIGFNFDRDLPRIPEFRQAIAHSLDIERIVESVFLTHAIYTRSPIHPMASFYETETPYWEYDMDIARRLAQQVIRQYGHLIPTTTVEDPYVDEDEWEVQQVPLRILVNKDNVEGMQIAQILANQMDELGFPVEVLSRGFGDFLWLLNNGHFDLFIGTYNLEPQPDLSFAFHSDSSDNLLAFGDAEMDRLLEVAAFSGADNLFNRAISDVQVYIAEQLPVISFAFRHSAVVMDTRIRGEIRPTMSNIFINVEEWFVVE